MGTDDPVRRSGMAAPRHACAPTLGSSTTPGDWPKLLRAMHYLLMYDLASDYLERRPTYREDHLRLAREAHSRGELVLAGALDDPVDQAVLFFEGESPEAAERFARTDPYVLHGLVRSWRVRPWRTVVGDHPAVPVV